jgi:hypothetical protein
MTLLRVCTSGGATIHGMTLRTGSGDESGFAGEYARMTQEELLKTAAGYDSLVEPAKDALRAEFAGRRMEPPLIEDNADRQEVSSERLVTLRSYSDISQAMVPKSVLESAGIYCFLQDENFVRVDWGAGIALGGVKLQVRPEDAQDAEQMLSQPIPEPMDSQGPEERV